MDVISELSDHFGMSQESIINQMFFMEKAKNNGQNMGIGSGQKNVPPWRGFEEDSLYSASYQGVKEQYLQGRIPDKELRRICDKNAVIGACINLNKDRVLPFSKVSSDEKKPGYQIYLKDSEKKPINKEKDEMKKIEQWFFTTGRRDFEGSDEREDDLSDYFQQVVEEYMTLGRETTEIRRDNNNNIVDFQVIDAATIKRVIKGGFQGSPSQINPDYYVYANTDFYKKMVKDKTKLIPRNSEDIAFVQSMYYDNRYVAAFSRKDLIFDSLHPRVDIRYKGFGMTYIEQMVSIITLYLNGISFNSEGLSNAAIPKLALNFEDGNFSRTQMYQMQDDWKNNYQGIDQWRIPILLGKVKAIDLLKAPRDLEHGNTMDLAGGTIHAVFGIDSQETGLNFRQSKAILSEGGGARLKISKSRSLNTILWALAGVCNKIMIQAGWADKYVFKFTGIEPEDREQDSKLETDSVKRDKTVNELRAEKDRKPIEGGDIILDPVYANYLSQSQAQGGEEEGFSQDDMGDIADEAIDDVFKAIANENEIRTLIK